MISLIAAVARNGVIGDSSAIPWYLPADLKYFARTTKGHAVVMGRKTFESIVDRLGHPLPDRQNIVVTRRNDFAAPGALVADSVDTALTQAEGDEIFVIGGGQIYDQTIAGADRLYLTEVAAEPDGDVRFPEFDRDAWREVSRESHRADPDNQFDYEFVVYERI